MVLGLITFVICAIAVYKIVSCPVDSNRAQIIRSAAAKGALVYRLTEPEEVKRLLGPSVTETVRTSIDGSKMLFLDYPDVHAVFRKVRYSFDKFTLYKITLGGKNVTIGNFSETVGGTYVDIGHGGQIVLRNAEDLEKIDPFSGFINVSLVNIDLRALSEQVEKMRFDSLTKWPEQNKMPEGFDPAKLLEEGKNPGLGIRRLHEQGIYGQGVGIAIIDQPLLQDHQEYIEQLVEYKEIGLMAKLVSPQMHGPPVASIAVGKTCGVAPGAALSYFALGMTSMPDNKIYCDIINKIIERNKNAAAVSEQIRVISISTGMFSHQANFELWKETLTKAERHGILVVTCDTDVLNYGTLTLIQGQDPDSPSSYRKGRYVRPDNAIRVPTGNKTTASHHGSDVYTYWTDGGMSWAAPYIAGLAALAFQVNPDLQPQAIVDQLVKTATHTKAGPVVNPVGFIEAVRKAMKDR